MTVDDPQIGNAPFFFRFGRKSKRIFLPFENTGYFGEKEKTLTFPKIGANSHVPAIPWAKKGIMMKKPTKTAAPNKAVVTTKTKALVSVADFDNGDNIPAGLENVTSKDLIIPRITILQALSPQLKKKAPEYISGATPGLFCDVGTGQTFEEELFFIPCFFMTAYLEWAPRSSGKGLQFNHGNNASILKKTKVVEDDEGRKKNMLSNGNYIQETAQYYGLNMSAKGRRSFIPLASTGLGASRRWMMKITSERLARSDGSEFPPPIYYRAWRATIAEAQKGGDSWFGWQWEPSDTILDLDPTGKLLHEAKEFYAQVRLGNVIGEVVVEEDENTGGSVM